MISDTPPMAPGIGGPNLDPPLPRLRPFEGDVAVKELRRRLALEPEVVPEPPMRRQGGRAFPWAARCAFILFLAATATFAVTLLTASRQPQMKSDSRVTSAPPRPDGPVADAVSISPARLIIENHRAFANEPLPLGVWLRDGGGGETVTLGGLAAGTKLTAGQPLGLTGWQIAARELGNVYAYAPKDFIGVMDAAIDLRSSRDRLVDSQIVRLEWLERRARAQALAQPKPEHPKPVPLVQLLPEEIAVLLKRGEELLQAGDIAAARLFLRRAVNAGSAEAALALGATYDPRYLAEQGVLGFAPDAAQARAWYEKAVELGSSEASRRLERLASSGG
ncbi:MAG TPA: hypothetical protein VGF60_15970 [Xanthobacteraceae bacterium]|jgi:hypothetical protein